MDIKVVFSIYKELIDDNLSLIYQGDFSDDVTAKILHLSENNIDTKFDASCQACEHTWKTTIDLDIANFFVG